MKDAERLIKIYLQNIFLYRKICIDLVLYLNVLIKYYFAILYYHEICNVVTRTCTFGCRSLSTDCIVRCRKIIIPVMIVNMWSSFPLILCMRMLSC